MSFDFDNEFKFIFSDSFTPSILSGKKHSEEILGYLSKLTILSSYLLSFAPFKLNLLWQMHFGFGFFYWNLLYA